MTTEEMLARAIEKVGWCYHDIKIILERPDYLNKETPEFVGLIKKLLDRIDSCFIAKNIVKEIAQ